MQRSELLGVLVLVVVPLNLQASVYFSVLSISSASKNAKITGAKIIK